ncbi:carboxymethylenebutenolidase [Bacillus sp. SA1-12]|uniref:alpha/beta fold hydrolase n=1 Tax=Bacillus sp. SA1-12 TaxID=1455638 RepID=UPI00062727DA|nr:alpha/beta fold hydrolase [Bacillus sp. SA1-12]KKI90850.1 carboxymethylenebutenolidase [Bacillus sp. SA1-12]
MKKVFRFGLISIIVLTVCTCLGFFIWSQQTYEPTEELYTLVDKNEIKQDEFGVIFKPKGNKDVGIILYPGAKVEPEAYSYIGQQLADQGYLVVIPRVLFNFSLFDINITQEIVNEFESVREWYVGGHSLGGVSAATYAYEHPNKVDGLILLASYPSNNNDFSNMDLPMLSIYAENDGLSTIEKINETKHLLSKRLMIYEIKGGNHAQFGIYGPQKGDNKATISIKEQQKTIVNVMSKWLSTFH